MGWRNGPPRLPLLRRLEPDPVERLETRNYTSRLRLTVTGPSPESCTLPRVEVGSFHLARGTARTRSATTSTESNVPCPVPQLVGIIVIEDFVRVLPNAARKKIQP
jgi:hypothetical protein